MIDPLAAELDIRVPPRLSYGCLVDLRRVLDTVLRTLSDQSSPAVPGATGAP
jgi:hypothetical protein